MTNTHEKFLWFLVAGLLGGLAEVLWVSLYTFSTHAHLTDIGRGITATVYPAAAELALAPFLGLAVHMGLSILLALGFGTLLWPMIERHCNRHKTAIIVASMVALAVTWKVNFFLLLPMWNPEFVTLLPLSVTLVSKLLFGLTMGITLVLYQGKWSPG